MTFGREHSQTLHALQDVYDEISSENWDGYGATAIKADSYSLALKFLEALPHGLPVPELTVDPDGEICFEWDLGPRRVFSVSLGTRGEPTFAGLFGRSKAYGTEYFNDDIPSPMVAKDPLWKSRYSKVHRDRSRLNRLRKNSFSCFDTLSRTEKLQ